MKRLKNEGRKGGVEVQAMQEKIPLKSSGVQWDQLNEAKTPMLGAHAATHPVDTPCWMQQARGREVS